MINATQFDDESEGNLYIYTSTICANFYLLVHDFLEFVLSNISYIKQMTFIGQMKTINEQNMPKNYLQMEFQMD